MGEDRVHGEERGGLLRVLQLKPGREQLGWFLRVL